MVLWDSSLPCSWSAGFLNKVTISFPPTCQFSLVESLSHVWIFANPWSAANKASLSITNSQSLLKLMSVESVMPFNHLILCRPALLLPSISPSIRVFPNESALRIRWPEYWSFSFNMSPSNEHSGLISFRMGWLDLLAIQGTLKSLLQHHSSKPLILQLLLDLHTGFSRGSSGGLVFLSLRIFHSLLWSTQSKD